MDSSDEMIQSLLHELKIRKKVHLTEIPGMLPKLSAQASKHFASKCVLLEFLRLHCSLFHLDGKTGYVAMTAENGPRHPGMGGTGTGFNGASIVANTHSKDPEAGYLPTRHDSIEEGDDLNSFRDGLLLCVEFLNSTNESMGKSTGNHVIPAVQRFPPTRKPQLQTMTGMSGTISAINTDSFEVMLGNRIILVLLDILYVNGRKATSLNNIELGQQVNFNCIQTQHKSGKWWKATLAWVGKKPYLPPNSTHPIHN